MCVCFDELPVKMCSLVGGWDGCIIFAGMCNNINRKSFGVLYLLSDLHTKKTTSDFDHENHDEERNVEQARVARCLQPGERTRKTQLRRRSPLSSKKASKENLHPGSDRR